MSPESLPAAEPQTAEMSEGARLTGVFFEPQKTFEDIARKPAFWVPLILLTLVSVIFTYLMLNRVGAENIVRQQMQMSARATQQMDQLPPDQRERAESMQQRMVPITRYAGALVGRPILFLVWGAILLGIARGIMSAPVRFKQIFAILCYASLPALIQTALTAVVMYLKKPEEFNIMNPLAFNPAAFMDPVNSSKFLYTLALSLDLFTIWVIFLQAVGLKAAGGGKISFGGALVAVALPWVVLVLIGASVAGMFS
jgi:hypothetical protein